MGASNVPAVTCFLMSAGDFRVASSKYRSSARASLTASADFHDTANGVIPLVQPKKVRSSLLEKFNVFAAAMILGEMWTLHR